MLCNMYYISFSAGEMHLLSWLHRLTDALWLQPIKSTDQCIPVYSSIGPPPALLADETLTTVTRYLTKPSLSRPANTTNKEKLLKLTMYVVCMYKSMVR